MCAISCLLLMIKRKKMQFQRCFSQESIGRVDSADQGYIACFVLVWSWSTLVWNGVKGLTLCLTTMQALGPYSTIFKDSFSLLLQCFLNLKVTQPQFTCCLTHYHTLRHFDTLKIYSCGKHCEKRIITCNKQFLLFSQCFLPYMVLIFHFKCTI